MRVRLAGFSIVLVLCTANSAHAVAPRYYLALGDSLAVGVQPTVRGDVPTNQGYADDLYALYHTRIPNLRLAKLGCSGETTKTMIVGGVCRYPLGSQLLQAVSFLQRHDVAFVTIDIGGDNVYRCFSLAGINGTCVIEGTAAAIIDLPQIISVLRAVAPTVPIYAMNYYDPFLAAWTIGPAGQVLAAQSLDLTLAFNNVLASIYAGFGIPVADVAAAYHITDLTPFFGTGIPLNVLVSLTWTWMGLPPPLGPDIHPNAVGYGAIAAAFVNVIGAP